MLKILKKYSKKFFIALSICLVSILTLFVSNKSYAYDYNSNTNQLVGNNILDDNSIEYYKNDASTNNGNVIINDVIMQDTSFILDANNSTNLNGYYHFIINKPTNFDTSTNYQIVMLIETYNSSSTNGSYYIGLQRYNSNNIALSNNLPSDYFSSILSNSSTPVKILYTLNGKSTSPFLNGGDWKNQSDKIGLCFNFTKSSFTGTLKIKFFVFKQNYDFNYFVSNNQTFVPYSSIEELQQNYNTLQQQYNVLQQQYNTLQSAYSQIANNYQTVIDNYNTLQNQYDALDNDFSTLQAQFNQLQIQYNAYVATHSYTDTEYNILNNQYNSLQNDYNSLVSTYFNLLRSYNDLQVRYNSLLADSTNAMYFALNGATANLYTDVSGSKTLLATDIVSINQNYMNFDNSCIPNINNYLNNYDSSDTTNYPNPYCYIEIELNMSVNSALLFTFDNSILDTDITLSSTISDVTTIYNRKSELNPYQLVVNSDRLSFNKITYDGIYMPDYISIDFSLQLDGYSYSLGYEKGVASQQAYINSLNSSVSSMQASINTLRASNQQLQEQVNNTFGWKNLFFAMADTPFKTVSNVLGFELFGLNLFTTFIGMITVFAIVWLLKKFI